MYNEGLVEEATYLFAEYLASAPVHGSIAFHEVVVPIVMILRKAVKVAKSSSWKAKEAGLAKGLVERIEESARWVEQKRKGVTFAPGRLGEVEAWESGVNTDDTPLGKYVKVQRKVREKRRKLVEKVCSERYIFSHLLSVSDDKCSRCRRGKARTRSWRTELLEIASQQFGISSRCLFQVEVCSVHRSMPLIEHT